MEKAGGKKQNPGGQITVFVSMILMLLFAFLCVLMESARTAGARWYLQMAASSAMDSVFSQYHRELWDRYRLLFAEYETGEEIEADFAGFLLPYLETDNWYPMALEEVSAEEIVRAVDGHGAYLEKEILDYMKYGIWNLDFEGDAVEGIWKQEREAEAVTEMAQTYRTRTRDVWKLERVLESISENLDYQRNDRQQGLNALSSYDGAGFRRAAEQMIGELKKMPQLVKHYEKEADKLAETLQKDRQEQENRVDRLGTEMTAALEQEIQEYEAYVAEDGKRRQEIRALEPRSAEQIQRLEELIELSYEVEREIEEWEDDDDEDGDSEPDYESLWRPVRIGLENIQILPLSFVHGIQDKEKEGWLKQVEQLYQEGMLGLLVPEGRQISEKTAVLAVLPSQTETYDEGAGSGSMPDHILVNEYCGMFFSQFCSMQTDTVGEVQKQKTGIVETENAVQAAVGQQKAEDYAQIAEHTLDYEMEYLIGGKNADQENLKAVVNRLLLMREGANLLYLETNPTKSQEAMDVALALTSAFANPELAEPVKHAILAAWAYAESISDVRILLNGGNVSLIKSDVQWHTDLKHLGDTLNTLEKNTEQEGLSYGGYLQLLLWTMLNEKISQRSMNLIEQNTGVCMNQMVGKIKCSVEYEAQPLFWNLVQLGNYDIGSYHFLENSEVRYAESKE